jgi:adenylosuccinate lyase
MPNNTYVTPLTSRYASEEMSYLFSPQYRDTTWRKIWIALAAGQQELGLPISDAQIEEMTKHVSEIDFDKARELEQELRHDVMAHVHLFGDQCPSAKPIIHLGATSCTVTDNGDLIAIKEALALTKGKLLQLLSQFAGFAEAHRSLPCLGFTHFQPAQPTTVGKRATLWLQDFLMDLELLVFHEEHLRFLGIKGTTGTQASFLSLFEGDHEKVSELELRVGQKLGFSKIFPVTGQTYSRKQDVYVLDLLAGVAVSAQKFATDLRLLSNLREMEEPFESGQVGSSAMPYKRNPMRSERICSLSRYLICLADHPKQTAATQWLERTLDDSANRRLTLAEGFLCVDGILNLLINITQGLIVYPKVIRRRLDEELPFMATENILMAAVRSGGDRQELHERLRKHSWEAARQIKEFGRPCDLLQRISEDDVFHLTLTQLHQLMDVDKFIGRAPEQVSEFLKDAVIPALAAHKRIDSSPCAVLV